MKTEIVFFELNPFKGVLRRHAEIIASFTPHSSTACVVAIGKNN